ncbi:MAG TPA: hypothetical protein VGH20_19305 [Myxococcales bacterium]|jgi:hypothetical protein
MRDEVNPMHSTKEIPYQAAPVFREEHGEGRLTRMVEQQVAKLPSGAFLVASMGSLAASLALEVTGQRRPSRFVGLWVGPLLSMGIYIKLLKLLGAR